MKEEEEQSLRCRLAAWADREMVFRWRNDPETRRNSLSTASISWESHTAWFKHMLARQEQRDAVMWILLLADLPVGSIRLEPDLETQDEAKLEPDSAEKVFEVSIQIAPEHRHHGFGRAALCKLPTWSTQWSKQIGTLTARVKADNFVSLRSFAQAGFKRLTEKDGVVFLQLHIRA